MPISFANIPADHNLPLFYAEVDASKAGTYVYDEPAFIFGQKLAAGSAAADVAVLIGSADDAADKFGRGSMAHRMVHAFRAINLNHELWVVPFDEPGTGVAATGSLAITGTATASGILTVYLAGQRVQVTVASGDDATTVGAALEAAVTAATDLPVTASNSLGTVTFTCRWKGETGNDITILPNHLGERGGEVTPAGLSLAVTAMASGAGAPATATAFGNVTEASIENAAFPFTDTTSLNAWETEFGAQDGGRWAWDRMQYGHGWAYMRGTFSALGTAGAARNDPAITIAGMPASRPTPVWEAAAARCAWAARALLNDPARPLQTLELTGVMAEPEEDQFTMQERSTLNKKGISTDMVMKDRSVQIETSVTTYQRNKYDLPDNAWQQVNTRATLARVLRRLRSAVTSNYPRHKLGNDGERFGAGQAVMTPNAAKAFIVAEYEDLNEEALVENVEAFMEYLIVERNAINPNRLDVLLPPDLVNQLQIFAVLAQFRLQF